VTTTAYIAKGKGDASSTLAQSFNNSRVGDGYREDWRLDISDWKTTTPASLTTGTSPSIGYSSNIMSISWGAGVTSAGVATIKIDGSAADTHAEMQLVTSMSQAGSNDTVTVTATVYAWRNGVGSIGPFTDTRSVTPGNASAEELVFNFSGKTDASGYKLEPGDNMTIQLAPSGNSNDTIVLYGSTWRRARNGGLTKIDDVSGTSHKNHRFYAYPQA
jgi:hypothetical protein